MYYTKFNTPIGIIILKGTHEGITNLYIDNGTKHIPIDDTWIQSDDMFVEAKKQLLEYLSGRRKEFQLKLAPQGTDFQQKIWNKLTHIPFGEVGSYKQIAEAAGNEKASRAVGMANNRNPIPIIIPCHRVIGSNKKMTGYAYGIELKEQLLMLEKINMIFSKLTAHFGILNWWNTDSKFEIMIGAILTQNTNWLNVDKSFNNMKGKLTPQHIELLSPEDLATLIRPSGYHNQKTLKLKALCEWFKTYHYDIDKVKQVDGEVLRKELLAINGVGPETADCILNYALDKPFLVIDTYTRRMMNRIGVDVPKDYDEFRSLIEQACPKDAETFREYHGLVVEHCKAFCMAKPQCDGCPLDNICAKR